MAQQAFSFDLEENFATPPLRGPHRSNVTPLPWELAAYRKIKNMKKKNKRRSSSEMEWTVTPTAAGPSGGGQLSSSCPANWLSQLLRRVGLAALLDNVERTLQSSLIFCIEERSVRVVRNIQTLKFKKKKKKKSEVCSSFLLDL
jgi:hypothetical protein